jgi:hypothetical protein
VTAKSLVLGFVAIMILSVTSGCYTVFQKATIDGKPPAVVTAETEGQFSGSVMLGICNCERWEYYFLRPWWEESIFVDMLRPDQDPNDAEIGEETTEGDGPVVIFVEPPFVEHVIRVPGTPNSSPNAEDTNVKYKQSDNDTGDGSSSTAETTRSKDTEPEKPARRGGTGGKR